MNRNRMIVICSSLVVAVVFNQKQALAQNKKSANPAPKAGEARVGEPYYLSDCPVSSKKLGSMGDPVIKIYDGREVRFCCPACPEKFEKDKAANLAKLDEKIIKDQGPLYPLKTSVVTEKALPVKPVDFVYGNRLVRVGADSEKAEFLKNPKKYLEQLDKATIAAQSKDYPLKTCLVSKEELGGAMGKPVDIVVAGRLMRLCCDHCRKDIEKDPAKFVAAIDAARSIPKSHTDEHHHHDGDQPTHKSHDH